MILMANPTYIYLGFLFFNFQMYHFFFFTEISKINTTSVFIFPNNQGLLTK